MRGKGRGGQPLQCPVGRVRPDPEEVPAVQDYVWFSSNSLHCLPFPAPLQTRGGGARVTEHGQGPPGRSRLRALGKFTYSS